MARKSKIESGKETDPAGLDPAARATEGITESKLKRKTAASGTRKKTAPKKTALVRKPIEPKKASRGTAVSEPTDEEIRLRAYFIAERRMKLSLAGDSAHDWIEARRQLVEEAGSKAS